MKAEQTGKAGLFQIAPYRQRRLGVEYQRW
jgi:hypothetical protein